MSVFVIENQQTSEVFMVIILMLNIKEGALYAQSHQGVMLFL